MQLLEHTLSTIREQSEIREHSEQIREHQKNTPPAERTHAPKRAIAIFIKPIPAIVFFLEGSSLFI